VWEKKAEESIADCEELAFAKLSRPNDPVSVSMHADVRRWKMGQTE